MRNYIELIVRLRWLVIAVILGLTVFFRKKTFGNLTVIIDPNTIVPNLILSYQPLLRSKKYLDHDTLPR